MELYINDIQVDLNERLPFPINFQVSDIRDISTRKGSSSKTITIPGTANNVKLMSGVFVVSATDSTSVNVIGFDNFDPTVKATARYYERGILQFEGICQLNDCIKIDGKWRFEMVLFQESIDIVKLLSNYKIRELGWSEYNHELNKTNQSNSWTGSIIKNAAAYSNVSGNDWLGEGYYYGLVDYGYDRPAADVFRVEDIAPQVFVKEIVDKMFEKIGVSYDSDFFETQLFKKLVLGYEGGEFPVVDSTISNNNSVQTDWLTSGGTVLDRTNTGVLSPNGDFWNFNSQQDLIDYVSNSGTATGETSLIQSHNPLKFVVQEQGLYQISFAGDFGVDLDFTVTGGSGSYQIEWTKIAIVRIYKNGQFSGIEEPLYFQTNTTSTTLTNNITVSGTFLFDLELEPFDLIEVKVALDNNHNFIDTGGTPTAVESQLTVSPDIDIDITLEQVSITEGQTVNIRQFLPEKMTCAEFFKGIVSMFNLIVKPNEDNPKELEIEPLDDFYLGTQDAFGNDITLDWTEIVDRSKEWRVTPTINFATKEYIFNFQDNKDYWNTRYSDDIDEQYGSKTLLNSSEFATGETEQKMPFSQVPIVTIPDTDLIVPRLFQVKADEGGLSTIKPKKGKAFIAQILNGNAGTQRTGDWKHRSTTPSVSDTAETEYPYVGHIDDPDTPAFDLLFQVPDYVFYELTGGQDYTTNNLYTYHEKSIRELIDRNGKLLTCYVKLDANIINTLDFKRLIKIDGVVYKLNKIENYDSNKNETTKVELLKIIEGSNLATYTSVDGKDDKYIINDLTIDLSKIQEGTATRSLGVDSGGKMVKSGEIGSGLSSGDIVYVAEKGDLPTPTGNEIRLADNTTYYFVTNVDLTGDRLVGRANTTILGSSSETASITSTGLGSTTALLTTTYTTPIQNITFKDVGTVLDIDGTGNTVALDWTAVNFVNVTTIGVIKNVDNFIYTKSALLDSQGLSFDGTIGTVSVNSSLLSGDAATADDIIRIESTATITRRFRVIYSSVIVSDPTTGINVESGVTIDNEAFILDTVNFAGGGSYLQGLDYTSNKASFSNCTSIMNSDEVAQYYMNTNTTATTITTIGAAVKAAGTTTAASFNQKFTHTSNRATYVGSKKRFFKVTATLSVNSGNNNEIGMYIAKNGTLLTESEIYVTTNAGGRAENGTVQTILELENTDYIEVFVENDSSTTDITVSELNVIVE